jgi:hypothetical protein
MANVVISNFINERWVDRIYQTFSKTPYVLKPDGTIENCKIKKVKSKYYLTSTGKWFNNAGLRIDEPAGLDIKAERSKFDSEIKQADLDAKFIKLKQTIRGN